MAVESCEDVRGVVRDGETGLVTANLHQLFKLLREWRERGREGGKERGREGGWERGKERGREGWSDESRRETSLSKCLKMTYFLLLFKVYKVS